MRSVCQVASSSDPQNRAQRKLDLRNSVLLFLALSGLGRTAGFLQEEARS